MVLLLLGGQFIARSQCINTPQLSFNQCQNSSLSFDSWDSTLVNARWYVNKLSVDSFNARVNMGNLSATIGTNTGLTLINEDSSWYGFYHTQTPNTFYRLNFGSSLGNTPTISAIVVNNIGSANGLCDGSLDFIKYNDEWVAFTTTRAPAAIVRYRFGSSVSADTVNADLITGLFGQITLPLDVEVIKVDSVYHLLVVGTTNRFVRYNIGLNPLTNTPSSYQTIITNSLTPSVTDPRTVVSKTICDTTVAFVAGRTSNNIVRLLFNDISAAPIDVQGVATAESWAGPYSLLLDAEGDGHKLYVQQWNSSPALGKIYSIDVSPISNSSTTALTRSEVVIPGGLYTTSFALGHDSAESYIFQTHYSNPGLYKSTSLPASGKAQQVFHNQQSFDLNALDTGLNIVIGEFFAADGRMVMSYDTINVVMAPENHIQLVNNCFSDTTQISVFDLNNVTTSRFWDFGNGDTLTSLSDTVSTAYATPNEYTVTLTSSNSQCVAIDSFPVTINYLPVSSFSADTACLGEVVNITNSSSIGGGDSITQYMWIFNNSDTVFSENPIYIANEIGSLDITLISYSSAGCTDTTSDSTFIKDAPSASYTFEQTCFGDSTHFISSVPQNSGYTIHWDFGDGQISGDSSPSHLYLDTGLYTVNLTVTASNGCQLSSSSPVLVSIAPDIDFAITGSLCQNEPVDFQANISSIDSIHTVAWHVLDTTFFGQSASIVLDTFGATNFFLEVIIGSDCRRDSNLTLFYNQAPRASFTLVDSCTNAQKTVYDNSDIPMSQSMVFNQWTFNGQSLTNQDSFVLEATIDSTYLLEYVIITDSNCTSIAGRNIQIIAAPSLDVNYIGPICTNSKLQIEIDTASGENDAAAQIIWQINHPNGSVDSINSFAPNIILTNDSAHTISAILLTQKGCLARSVDSIRALLSPRLLMDDDSICQLTELKLQSNYSGSNYVHNWSFSNLSYTNTNAISVIFDQPGNYDFELNILDESTLCTDTSYFVVYVGEPIQADLASSILCRNQMNEVGALVSLDTFDAVKDMTWKKEGSIISIGSSAYIEGNDDQIIQLAIESQMGCRFNADFILLVDTISTPSINLSKPYGLVPFDCEVSFSGDNAFGVSHVFLGDTFSTNAMNLNIDTVGLYELTTIITNATGCTYDVINKIIGYDNAPDLGVSEVFVSNTLSQVFLNAVFVNNSNIEIRNFEFEVVFENGSGITYKVDQSLEPGELFEYQTPIISNSTDQNLLCCVNIILVNDDVDLNTANNYKCTESEPKVRLSPNPFYNAINLQFLNAVESDVKYAVYTVNGSSVLEGTIKKEQFNPGYAIPVHLLSSGEYILHVRSNEFEFLNKIVKL